MSFPSSVERWRTVANWESRDIPTDLVLSIIAHESGGVAGIGSPVEGTPGDLPLMSGGTRRVDRSYGLMQIQPAIVLGWNKKHNGSDRVFYEDITGQTERAARLQVRLGAWHYGSHIAQLNKHFPASFPSGNAVQASPDQLRLALVAYQAGGNWRALKGRGLGPKLRALQARDLPLTFDNLKKTFPNWIPRTMSSVERRWKNYLDVSNSDPLDLTKTKPRSIDAAPAQKKEFPILIIGGLALGGLWLLQQNREHVEQ